MHRSVRNQLLLALPAEDRQAVLDEAHPAGFALADVIYEPGQRIDSVWFIDGGIISMVTVMSDGASVETMTVGFEGVLGLAAAFRPQTSFARAVTQVPGQGWRVDAARLRALADQSPALRGVCADYVDLMSSEAQQTAACNALHHLTARLAKWLLRCRDRADSDVLPLTQEFMGEMLGAHRTTVTQVARELQIAGVIRYQRGRIEITDRPRLEMIACECYGSITDRWGRMAASWTPEARG